MCTSKFVGSIRDLRKLKKKHIQLVHYDVTAPTNLNCSLCKMFANNVVQNRIFASALAEKQPSGPRAISQLMSELA